MSTSAVAPGCRRWSDARADGGLFTDEVMFPTCPASVAAKRVLVVDDDPRVLEAASQLIAAADGVELAGAVTNGAQALGADAAQPADVALVDVLLPSAAEGVALIQALAARGWRVVATSVSGAQRDATLAAGAKVFVEKAPDPHAVLSALTAGGT